MRKFACFAASAALVLATFPAALFAAPANAASAMLSLPDDLSSCESGELLVVLDDDAVAQEKADELADGIAAAEDVEVVATEDHASGAVLKVSLQDGESLPDVAADIASQDEIALVQPNYTYSLLDEPCTTDDAYAGLQTYLDGGRNLYGANVRAAWAKVRCEGSVTVAVLDSGIEAKGVRVTDEAGNQLYDERGLPLVRDEVAHEDLAPNVLSEYMRDMTANSPRGRITSSSANPCGDVSGHGTHVAGIIGAVADNGVGVAGASFNARILPLKVCNSQGGTSDTATLIKAYKYLFSLVDAGELTDLHVVNMSLGSYAVDEKDAALESLIATARDDYDIVSVCAGGNGYTAEDERDGLGRAGTARTDAMYPGDFEECVSVTALGTTGDNAAFSDYNASKDISAAGVSIYSTYPRHIEQKYADGDAGYEMLSGTSMATPLVSGIFALLWAADPELTVDEAVRAVYETAREVKGGFYDRRAASGSHGAIDAAAAVEYVIAHRDDAPDPDDPPAPQQYDDVQNPNAYYYESVYKLRQLGLMTGIGGTNDFGVGITLTRAQLAAIMWRIDEPDAARAYDASTARNETGMSDVRAGQWYTGAANWAVRERVINGVANRDGSRSFAPDRTVTFEQMLAVLGNYIDADASGKAPYSALAVPFADEGSVSKWARSSVAWAYASGLFSGSLRNGKRHIDPVAPVFRERAATVLANAIERGTLGV